MATCFAMALVSCSEEGEQILENTAFRDEIELHLEDYISKGSFSYEIEDFSTGNLNVSTGSGATVITSAYCTNQTPASCISMGSPEMLRVNDSSILEFDREIMVLGLHISLDRKQAIALANMQPEMGTGSVIILPQFRVMVTGLDAHGREVGTLRNILASATYNKSYLQDQWHWVNTSELGRVSGLRIHITSPVEGTTNILLDNITFSHDFIPSDAYFTIGLIPDTQKYCEFPELNHIYHVQTQYLASMVDDLNIAFVSHLGDMVEHGELASEWLVADAAMSHLDGILPYGLVVGNHDYEDEWDNPQDGSPLFNKYFPESRFSSYDWWGGRAPDGLSSYQIFPTTLGDFLYFHLSVDSPPPTVEWATSILNEHPGIPTLITTHAYLRENGRIPVPYLSAGSTESWMGISADELFDRLVAPNNQVIMVTCGHISAEHRQVSSNLDGNEVFELLQDYQNREHGGEGFLRLMKFYPGLNRVRILTYSPWLDEYEMDEDSYFDLHINFTSRLGI